MISGYWEFEFDLPGALLSHLIAVLDGMQAARLTAESLDAIPDAQGVYQIYLDDELVYIGKTDAAAGLRSRLRRHNNKIQHRTTLNPDRVSFKAVRIFVFTAIDLETQLIAHYGGEGRVRWNGSGFGANDPGKERDTTRYADDHFDAMYPIDIDRLLPMTLPSESSAAVVLANLKSSLPYTFRFQAAGPRSRQPHPELISTGVKIPEGLAVTARNVLVVVVPQLPHGWQATQLPSHIILYKDRREYPQGAIIAVS